VLGTTPPTTTRQSTAYARVHLPYLGESSHVYDRRRRRLLAAWLWQCANAPSEMAPSDG